MSVFPKFSRRPILAGILLGIMAIPDLSGAAPRTPYGKCVKDAQAEYQACLRSCNPQSSPQDNGCRQNCLDWYDINFQSCQGLPSCDDLGGCGIFGPVIGGGSNYFPFWLQSKPSQGGQR